MTLYEMDICPAYRLQAAIAGLRSMRVAGTLSEAGERHLGEMIAAARRRNLSI